MKRPRPPLRPHIRDGRSWYHVVLTAYGNWLPGDPRGFRTPKHREHVEGDYKQPPPKGRYDGLHQNRLESMRNDRYRIPKALFKQVGEAIVDVLHDKNVFVMCICVQRAHCHLLVKASRFLLNKFLGIAKRKASRICVKHSGDRRIWAKKCSRKPVTKLSHFRNAYRYILAHGQRGAWTWSSDFPCP
ncbi:MAG: hypothetical protein QM811_21050 [Pirellulales bacterium]